MQRHLSETHSPQMTLGRGCLSGVAIAPRTRTCKSQTAERNSATRSSSIWASNGDLIRCRGSPQWDLPRHGLFQWFPGIPFKNDFPCPTHQATWWFTAPPNSAFNFVPVYIPYLPQSQWIITMSQCATGQLSTRTLTCLLPLRQVRG